MAVTVAALLLASSGALLLASSAAASRTLRSRCLPRGSETIAQDKSVRVYRLPPYIEGVAAKRPGIYGCMLRTGRTVKLKDRIELVPQRPAHYHPLELREFVLAGTVVAYIQSYVLVDVSCTDIVVLNLATGRIVLEVSQGCSVDAGFLSIHDVTSLVVNELGCIAWILGVGRRSAETFEVHTEVPFVLANRLIDASAEIVPNSLRLAPGSEITWLDAGHAMYAMCHGPAHP
jgi:hypothetical protein